MKLLRFAVCGLVLSGWTATVRAQQQSQALQREARIQELQQLQLDNRLRANPDVPVGERALVDYGGYLTASYLSLDDPQGHVHGLREYDAVGYARVQFDGAHEFFIRGQEGYRDFNRGDSFNGFGDRPVGQDLDRAFYRFNLNGLQQSAGHTPSDTNIIFKGGRDLAYWANGLVLAQTLDGMTLDVASPNLDLQLLGGVTVTRTVDFDPSRPEFDHNTRRGFYGAMLSTQVQGHRPYVYGLEQRDYNRDHNFSTTGNIPTRFSYNSYYLGLGSTGNLSDRIRYGIEAAWESGNGLSNSFQVQGQSIVPVTQTRDSINAVAVDGRLEYLIQDPHLSRFSGEIIAASGDTDRGNTNSTFNGNRPGTTDTAFNSFGLLNTGLAFAPAVSNITALRLGASTFPMPSAGITQRLQVGADFFVYGKLSRNAPIDEQTLHEWFLGVEPDVYLNWQLASDITLVMRYGLFVPNSSAFPRNDTRQFIYTGVTFAF